MTQAETLPTERKRPDDKPPAVEAAPRRTPAQRLWGNAYLLLALTMLMWGGNAVASRLAVGEISPMALTSLRWVFVCAILPWLVRRELVAWWPVFRANAALIIGMGMVGFTGFNALMYLAAHSTSAINIGILQGAIPVVVLLGAFLAYRTPIGPLQALGVLVTLAGVVVVASRGDYHVLTQLAFFPGDLWMILASFFYAAYTIAIRSRPDMPGLVFFTALALVACFGSLPLLALEVATGAVVWPTQKGWLILAYVVIFPSLLSQLFFLRAVGLIGPGRAGVFVNLVPVFAAVLAVLVLGERLALYHGAALALVLGGIFIAERRGRRADALP